MKIRTFASCEGCNTVILDPAAGVILSGTISAGDPEAEKILIGGASEKTAHCIPCLMKALGVGVPTAAAVIIPLTETAAEQPASKPRGRPKGSTNAAKTPPPTAPPEDRQPGEDDGEETPAAPAVPAGTTVDQEDPFA